MINEILGSFLRIFSQIISISLFISIPTLLILGIVFLVKSINKSKL